jgi:hypothetical protein
MTPRDSTAAAEFAFRKALGHSVIAAGLLLASATSAAQGVVTLYGGARDGGDFIDDNTGMTVQLDSGAAFSLSLDWPLSDGRQAQVFYSFQRSALPRSVVNQAGDVGVNINYLHGGGRVFFHGTQDTSAAYVVGGLGITYFSPSLSGLSSELRPSANLGLGYQWMLSKQVALRTELRGYLTLINSEGGFFCSGGCVVSIRGDTMTQVEGLLGVSIGF